MVLPRKALARPIHTKHSQCLYLFKLSKFVSSCFLGYTEGDIRGSRFFFSHKWAATWRIFNIACRTCNEPHSLRTCSLCNSFIFSTQCLKNVSLNNKLCRNCTVRRMEEILLKEYREGFIVPKYKEKLVFLTSYHDLHRCSKCWKVSTKT